MSGFVKLSRAHQTFMLLKNPVAFALFALIALRARRSHVAPNPEKLEINQALIGDIEATGATHRSYRTAKKRLAALGVASFRTTNRGTIATITNTDIFDVNADDVDNEVASPALVETPAADKQTGTPDATNKNEKKTKKPNKESPSLPVCLDTPEFRRAWDSWVEYRVERRLPPMVASSTTAKLAELATMGEAAAIDAIRHSIRNSWNSIHPPPGKSKIAITASQYAGKF